MPTPRAVFLDAGTLDRGDLDLNSLQTTPYAWEFYDNTSPEQCAGRIRGAALVVSNKVVMDRTLISGSGDLQLICAAATGVNHIDLLAAAEQNIAVTNVTGYGTATVAQHTFGLILALSTRLLEYQSAVRRGDWSRSELFCLMDYPIREIAGKTLGIVGYGTLGRGVARIAEAFDMEVLLAQRPGGEARAGRLPLDQLLPRVDVLSLHCPLTEHTRNLIGPDQLALMRSDALLINTARGGVVDEAALAEVLLQGKLGGAGVDVLTREPPPVDHPLLQAEIPNLIVTPHNAWASLEARQRLLNAVAANNSDLLAGGTGNRVERSMLLPNRRAMPPVAGDCHNTGTGQETQGKTASSASSTGSIFSIPQAMEKPSASSAGAQRITVTTACNGGVMALTGWMARFSVAPGITSSAVRNCTPPALRSLTIAFCTASDPATRKRASQSTAMR